MLSGDAGGKLFRVFMHGVVAKHATAHQDCGMDRMLPADTAEPIVRGGAGASVFRGTVYAMLGLAVACGAWVRFNAQVSAAIPGLVGAGGATGAAQGGVRPLLGLGLVPAGEAEGLVAGMGLSGVEAGLLRTALREQRLRLVRMPLVDETVASAGHDVVLSTAGYTRVVRLTRDPVAVALPVAAGGEVAFSTPDADAVGIGALGLSGPVRLPDLARGDVLSVGVVAQ